MQQYNGGTIKTCIFGYGLWGLRGEGEYIK
jgi:hypothetical protein